MNRLPALAAVLSIASLACGQPPPDLSRETEALRTKSREGKKWATCGKPTPSFESRTIPVFGPQPPTQYTLPTGPGSLPDPIPVGDDQPDYLLALTRDGQINDIILEDGHYHLDAMNLVDGDRLWARNVGQAVFHFGVGIRSPSTELHGIRFDIDDPANAFRVGPIGNSNTAAVAVYGNGRSARIEDCFFEGNVAIDSAISASRTDRLGIVRVDIRRFLDYGIVVNSAFPYSDTSQGTQGPASLRDIRIGQIENPFVAYPQSNREHGLSISSFAYVDRVQIRDVGVTGINIGTTPTAVDRTRVHLSNIDVDYTGLAPESEGIGVYFEKRNEGSSLRRFCIGPNGNRGINIEWAGNVNPDPSQDIVIEDGSIEAQRIGIALDVDNLNTHFEDIEISNASWAGLLYKTGFGTTACNLDFNLSAQVCEFTTIQYGLTAPPPTFPSQCASAPPCF